jgi:hypothetical protein
MRDALAAAFGRRLVAIAVFFAIFVVIGLLGRLVIA